MRRTVRLFLVVEAVTFVLASLVHTGVVLAGDEHRQAAIAEGVIGAILLVGLGLTAVWSGSTRTIGLTAQGLALLGTLVGAFTIAIGIGPRTLLDVVYHAAILIALAWGLAVAARTPTAGQGTSA